VAAFLLVEGFFFRDANRLQDSSSNLMMEESDAAAVARARAGDQDGFRVLVERHSHALFRLAYRMTGNEQDAEDMVQETFLRAYRQLGRFESRANFSTWLHRIAANCSLDLLRKRKRRDHHDQAAEGVSAADLDSLPARGTAPDHALCHREVAGQVESALDDLTPMERAAFVLRHFENRSIGEIGAALELGQSAAKQAIFRAVQKMRRALDTVWGSTK
jgi:RNA polymerase sigma-70 factor (ECF subfamily)